MTEFYLFRVLEIYYRPHGSKEDPTGHPGTKKTLSQVLVHCHDSISINMRKKFTNAKESSCPITLLPSVSLAVESHLVAQFS